MDSKLRDSRRRLVSDGTREDEVRYAREQLRRGERDPRLWPRPGDIIRVPMHGANVERWDERRIVSCDEVKRNHIRFNAVHRCYCWGAPYLSFSKSSERVLHWERTSETFDVLYNWGLARDRRGSIARLGSWRAWAKRGEVVFIAPESEDL